MRLNRISKRKAERLKWSRNANAVRLCAAVMNNYEPEARYVGQESL